MLTALAFPVALRVFNHGVGAQLLDESSMLAAAAHQHKGAVVPLRDLYGKGSNTPAAAQDSDLWHILAPLADLF